MGKRYRRNDAAPKKPKNNRKLLIGLVTLAAVVIAGIIIFISTSKPSPVLAAPPQADGMSMGNPDAKVIVVEYSDFQCPFCGRFSRDFEPEIIEKYVATGKIYYTHTPFAFLGNESLRAAEAAYCAADQNRFWQFKKVLFDNQAGENQGGFSDSRLIRYAQQAGLTMTEFRPCFDQRKYQQQVKDDYQLAQEKSIQGTPTFLVNGNGPIDMNGLTQAIDQALAANP